jgi:hypothetical protein
MTNLAVSPRRVIRGCRYLGFLHRRYAFPRDRCSEMRQPAGVLAVPGAEHLRWRSPPQAFSGSAAKIGTKAEARKRRRRAEKCRAHAAEMRDPDARAGLIQVAESYERMADAIEVRLGDDDPPDLR